MFEPNSTLAGYRLIRPIGAGGFGEVWLAHSETLNQPVALKILHAGDTRRLERELAALQRFKTLALSPAAIALMPIEHVGNLEGRLFYVMPLADGLSPDLPPDDPAWQPLTLRARLHQHSTQKPASSGGWLTSSEIIGWLAPVARAVASLGDAGLVHRDIKPDNILFLHGRPVLSDFSLLTVDAFGLTEIGTPGYRAPSWYVDTGGNPDIYGLAATLYTALTGNAPDKLGRANYRWPPNGEASLSPSEHAEWLRLHRILLRAVHETASERFLTVSAFANALEATEAVKSIASACQRRRSYGLLLIAIIVSCLGVVFWLFPSRSDVAAITPTHQIATQGSAQIISAKAKLPDWKEYDELFSKLQNAINEYSEKTKEEHQIASNYVYDWNRGDDIKVVMAQRSKSFKSMRSTELLREQRLFVSTTVKALRGILQTAETTTSQNFTVWAEADKRTKALDELYRAWGFREIPPQSHPLAEIDHP